VADLYALHPFTNSTKLRNAIPDGPLAIHGLLVFHPRGAGDVEMEPRSIFGKFLQDMPRQS
jgi:hypothetical protein